MLTPTEVAKTISTRIGRPFSVQTVYTWLRANKLRSKRLGMKLFISPRDLDVFLSEFQELDRQPIKAGSAAKHA
jgi:hypothetical protein